MIVKEFTDGILTLTINRPEKKNALTPEMYGDLADAIQQATFDNSIRVLLVRGTQGIFTAGNDLKDFAFVSEHPEFRIKELPVFRFMHAVLNLDKPLVACVNGPAVGIGTTLLFHCDAVVAGTDATFALPFVHLNLVPEFGSTYLFPRISGRNRAQYFLLSGEKFTASMAEEFGIVTHLTNPEDTQNVAWDIAQKFSAIENRTLRAIKGLLVAEIKPELEDAMDRELQAFEEALKTPEHRKALRDFFHERQKRKQ